MSFIESKVTDFITRGIAFRYISEPDKGIYDAMNKAAHYADNDYLLFLNAGDEFYAGDTLLNVQKQLCETDADIVYGSTLFCGNWSLSGTKAEGLEYNYRANAFLPSICIGAYFSIARTSF